MVGVFCAFASVPEDKGPTTRDVTREMLYELRPYIYLSVAPNSSSSSSLNNNGDREYPSNNDE